MERARPVVYYKDGCEKCATVLDYLANRNVAVEKIEVSQDEGAREALQKKTGQGALPTLVHGREVLADFDVPKLASFLDRFKLSTRPGDR
jgi:glutaredoxin